MKRRILSLLIAILMIIGLSVAPTKYVAKAADGKMITWDIQYEGGKNNQVFRVVNNQGTPVSCVLKEKAVPVLPTEKLEPGEEYAFMVEDNAKKYTMYVYDSEDGTGTVLEQFTTKDTHEYEVYATDQDGNKLEFITEEAGADGKYKTTSLIQRGHVDRNSNFKVVPPTIIFTEDGNGNDIEWILDDAVDKTASYETFEMFFKYKKADKEDRKIRIRCLNENGHVIMEDDSLKVSYNSSVDYTVEETITHPTTGRTYKLVDDTQKGVHTVKYNDYEAVYDYTYELVKTDVDKDYVVTVQSVVVDENGKEKNVVLGVDTFTYNDKSGVPYIYTVKNETLSVKNYADGTVSYFRLYDVADKVITHQPGGVDSYKVRYVEEGKDTPYTWVIQGIDVATQKIVYTESFLIPVDGEHTFRTDDKTLVTSAEGVQYAIDETAESIYTHKFNPNADRVTYIPYHEAGADAVTKYDIKVQYVNVRGFEVLETRTITVKANEGDVTIDSPEKLNVKGDETNYVMLKGEVPSRIHKFYMPHRTYSVFYRDEKDMDNLDTTRTEVTEVINYEDVVTTETYDVENTVVLPGEVVEVDGGTTAIDGGTTTTDAVAATPVATPPTTLVVNPSGGETTLLDEEAVPLAENVQDVEDLDEGEVPLGASADYEDKDNDKGQVASIVSNLPLVIGIGAVILIILAAILLLYKKKQNGTPE